MVRKFFTSTRVIHTDPPNIERGWPTRLSNDDKVSATKALTAIKGMDYMQTDRTGHVPASSMYQALLDERRILTNQALVYLPTLEFDTLQMDFFSDNAGDRRRACDSIARRLEFSDDFDDECIGIVHPCLKPARNAFFFIIPVRMEEHWITIFGVIRNKETATIKYPDIFWDKTATHVVILDPHPTDRYLRKKRAMESLAAIFTEANIQICDAAYSNAQATRMTLPDTPETWETGLVTYSVCAELLERSEFYYEIHRNASNLVDAERSTARDDAFDRIWDPIKRQTYKYEFYRDRIRNACASRAIQQTEYRTRMAIEIPGSGACRDHKLMLKANHRKAIVPFVPPRECILGPSNDASLGYLYIRDENDPSGIVAKRARVTGHLGDDIDDSLSDENESREKSHAGEEEDGEEGEEEEEVDEPPAKRTRIGST